MSATQWKEGHPGGHEEALAKLVRFAIDVTKGVTSVTEREARATVDRVVEAGRLSAEEGNRLCEALVARMERSRQHFEQRVDEAVQQAVRELSNISAKELDHLRLKTAELERRVGSLGA